jgi:single-strand DNA-binding protein
VNETIVTVVGNVAQEPRMRVTSAGARVSSFRLASTERRFNRQLGGWRDGDTTFYTVTCWRTMAENVFESLKTGQPVVVQGRLRTSSYEKDGQRRTSVEIEASAVGHDLARGVSTFIKAGPGASPERELVGELASELDRELEGETDREIDGERVDPLTGELLGRLAVGDGFAGHDAGEGTGEPGERTGEPGEGAREPAA